VGNNTENVILAELGICSVTFGFCLEAEGLIHPVLFMFQCVPCYFSLLLAALLLSSSVVTVLA